MQPSRTWRKRKQSERTLPPNVVRRGDAFVYRRVVPQTVRARIGRSDFLKTWRAGTPLHRVTAEAELLRACHGLMIERAEAGEVFDRAAIEQGEREAAKLLLKSEAQRAAILGAYIEQGFFDPEVSPQDAVVLNALKHGGKYAPPTPALTLEKAYEVDKARFGGKRDEAPIKNAIDSFTPHVAGLDLLTGIRTEHALKWLDAQRRTDLAESTIRRQANAIQGVISRTFRAHEVARVNPFSKLGIGGKHKETDRLPFTRRHLDLIDAHLPKCSRDVRNLLTLIKYTGASASELAGSLVANVHLDAAVPHISIRPNEVRRRLKTESRQRSIPLVGPALDAARDAVECSKGNGSAQLFKGFSTKHGANSLSGQLSKAIRAAGVPKSPRLTVYSFRHTLIEAMRQAGVSSDLRRMIVGHSAKDSHDRYGSPAALLKDMRRAISKAIPFLGQVDESAYMRHEIGASLI